MSYTDLTTTIIWSTVSNAAVSAILLAHESSLSSNTGADVIIQAEEQLYWVPKALLELHSEVLRNALKPQRMPGEFFAQDSIDEDHFILEDMASHEFALILHIMTRPQLTPIQRSPYRWLSLLRKVTKLGFSMIRHFIILTVDDWVTKQLPALDIVLLARDFQVYHWLLAGYSGLLSGKEPLSPEELRLIGAPHGLKLLRERQRCYELQHRALMTFEPGYWFCDSSQSENGLRDNMNIGFHSVCEHSHSDALLELFYDEFMQMERVLLDE